MLASGGTCPLCLRWAARVTRLHQGFSSSLQPAPNITVISMLQGRGGRCGALIPQPSTS